MSGFPRRTDKSKALIFLLTIVLALASCGAEEILGLNRSEALELIRKGDVAFIIQADTTRYATLAKPDPALPFYLSLQAETAGAGVSIIEALAEASWKAGKGVLRREAGKRFLSVFLKSVRESALGTALPDERRESVRKVVDEALGNFQDDREFRALAIETCLVLGDAAGVMSVLGQKGEFARTDSEKVSSLLASAILKQGDIHSRTTELFLDGNYGTDLHAAWEELKRLEPVFTNASAFRRLDWQISGRASVLSRSYGDALKYFKLALAENTGDFLLHDGLLGDLGKAYQYGASTREGVELFRLWARTVERDGTSLGLEGMGKTRLDALRFKLIFYAARMQRQLGDHVAANEGFAEALLLAPDATQREACIWYSLDGTATVSLPLTLKLLGTYAPLWESPRFYEDFLDRYSGLLVKNKDWLALADAFRIIRPVADPATVARFAYILGRAVALEYIRPNQEQGIETATAYFRLAFEADSASFYYRCMAASRLGENVDPIPAEASLNRLSFKTVPENTAGTGGMKRIEINPATRIAGSADRTSEPDAQGFLAGFFGYGVADKAYPFVHAYLEVLEAKDIVDLAENFARSARYGDSIRLMNNLANRPGYLLTRRDMELLYPRYFEGEMRSAASRWGVEEEILFGLVRTESAFIPDVVSHAGAVGLAQLMPATGLDVANRIRRSVELRFMEKEPDLRDPLTNLHLGAWYYADLLRRTERPMLALFSYNGGISRVRRWAAEEKTLPEDLFLETISIKETRDYGRKVLAAGAVYGYLYYGKTLEQVVSDLFPEHLTGGTP